MEAGSLREAGEEGAEGGISKGGGAGRNGKHFATYAQYFAIGKAHRGGNCYGRGWEPGMQGAGGGKFRPPCSPPPPPTKSDQVLHEKNSRISMSNTVKFRK